MEKGFLLLVGNYYDLVHYIEIDGVYFTLSRDRVEKIDDIKAGVQFYIKKVSLEQLEQMRPVDPYYLEEPKLTAADRLAIAEDESYKSITININNNEQLINSFQALSVDEDFAYFKNLAEDTVVLLEYLEI